MDGDRAWRHVAETVEAEASENAALRPGRAELLKDRGARPVRTRDRLEHYLHRAHRLRLPHLICAGGRLRGGEPAYEAPLPGRQPLDRDARVGDIHADSR